MEADGEMGEEVEGTPLPFLFFCVFDPFGFLFRYYIQIGVCKTYYKDGFMTQIV